MSISTPKNITRQYSYVFDDLIAQLKTKNWSYEVLDKTCIHIGAYKDEGLKLAPFVIGSILKAKTKNYIVIDFMSIVKNISKPLFEKPLSPDSLIDILVGDLKFIIGFDIDAFLEVFNDIGLVATYLTEKETMKLKQKEGKNKVIYTVNKRAIQVKNPANGKSTIIGGGIISKILYDSILPSNIALTILDFLSSDDSEDNSNIETH